MRSQLISLCILVLTGCGGGNYAYVPPSSARTSSASAPPAAPSASFNDGPAATAEPLARSERSRPFAPTPHTQPSDLGTLWGESRDSRSLETTFIRDTSKPFDLLSITYNDQQGVSRLVGYQSGYNVPAQFTMNGGSIDVSVVDQNGRPFDAVESHGRHYVIGRNGAKYTILIANRTPMRIEAVATVDGLDVINGKEGELSNRGYVVGPYDTLTIDGFRQSSTSVAAFRFGSVAQSYAARTGRSRNVGVIGVAFFAERGAYLNRDAARQTANPFPSDPRFAQPPP